MKVVVFGAGYVGLSTAAVLAHLDHDVTVVDKLPDKIEKIAQGVSPILEAGMDALLEWLVRSGRLTVARTAESAGAADVIFIAVGTPRLANGQTDLTAVEEVARGIGA